jgi:catechol 2,3-dioxygenase-like lactoylglutathione lyase family enzyme
MQGVSTIIVPVKDIERSTALYKSLLGVDPYVDQPYYVGFRLGEQEIGLNPHGHAEGMSGPVGYVEVADIALTMKTLSAGGATTRADVRDVGGGKLIATMLDADGNPIGLMQTP